MTAGPSDAARREYDRFGPWVLEISADDPVPPLFAPHCGLADEPILQVKVPRQIARRDAQPGTDLYDYLVTLYGDEMVVLERDGKGVRERTITYVDIKQLTVQEDLLRGRLHLGLPEAPLTLPFNTVSSEVITRVAGIIRERYRPSTEERVAPPATKAGDALSFGFEHLLQQQRSADRHVVATLTQPQRSLRDTERSLWRRILFGIMDRRLLESMHLSDGLELHVFDRGRSYAHRWESVYGRRETFMPLANLTDVEWQAGGNGPSSLTISTAGGVNTWAILGRDEEAADHVRWLRTAIATRRG